MDEWLEVASQVVSGSSFEPLCASINKFLALRTFLVGYAPTVADVALWGQLQGEWLQAAAAGQGMPCCSRECWTSCTERGPASCTLHPMLDLVLG